jgi:hypothetical protein
MSARRWLSKTVCAVAVACAPVEAPPVPEPERPERRAPRIEPAGLVGLDPDQLAALLGRPAALREEPPATVWSYRAGACQLDVFFFMSVETRALKALAYDLKAPGDKSDCVDSIVAENRDRR